VKRPLLKIAIRTSLTLAIACTLAFLGSYRWTHAVEGFGRSTTGIAATYRGSLVVGVAVAPLPRLYWLVVPSENAAIRDGFLAFRWQNDRIVKLIGVPLWLLSAVFAWLFVRLHRATRVRSPGLCPTCGYDLRATPERCPECGSVAVIAACPPTPSVTPRA
jgi:hypothetical protein